MYPYFHLFNILFLRKTMVSWIDWVWQLLFLQRNEKSDERNPTNSIQSELFQTLLLIRSRINQNWIYNSNHFHLWFVRIKAKWIGLVGFHASVFLFVQNFISSKNNDFLDWLGMAAIVFSEEPIVRWMKSYQFDSF